MSTENRFQLGPFWLGQRAGSPVWYIHWNVPGPKGQRGRTKRHSTGERDFGRAQKRLAEHFLKHVELQKEPAAQVTIAFLMDRDYERHGQKLASRDTAASAVAKWKAFWQDATVDQLASDARQREFIAWLERQEPDNSRNPTLAPSTVSRQLNYGRSALSRAYKRHEIASVPYVMTYREYTGEQMDPADTRRERDLTMDEMAALFNAAAQTEHLWRYMILMVGTCARGGAPLQIGPSQVDFLHERLSLLPPGRRQTKKRRPILPICPTLLHWLRIWCAEENLVYRSQDGQETRLDALVTWRGQRLKSIRDGFRLLKERAEISDPEVVPTCIRHTISTWMAERDVPEREHEIFMGHRMPGSSTTRRYIHLKPGYLRNAAAAVEAYFVELAPHVHRPLLASCAPARSTDRPQKAA